MMRLRLEAEWETGFTQLWSYSSRPCELFVIFNQIQIIYETENDSTDWDDNKNVGNGYDLGGGLNVIFSHKFPNQEGHWPLNLVQVSSKCWQWNKSIRINTPMIPPL